MHATSAAVTTFRAEMTRRDPAVIVPPDQEYSRRAGLYALHWSFYANDVYQTINRQASSYKAARGLYRHTRGCYNPAARIAGFYRSYLWGGPLDRKAGDGQGIASALPIEGANAAFRAALSRLWWDSNWQVKKDVLTLWGTVLGDVALTIRDEPGAGLVSLEAVHPATVRWVDRDPRGEVIAYVRQEDRPDPRAPRPDGRAGTVAPRMVCYTEVAELVNGPAGMGALGKVHYRTFLDGAPFDWRVGPDGRARGNGPGAQPEWDAPYGFVPLWLIAHIDAGLPWGLSEFDAGRDKFDEVNDLGSKLHDHVRRATEGDMLLAGVRDPSQTPVAPRTGRTASDPQPGRTQKKFLYAEKDAKAYSLINDLDLAHVSAEIRQQLDGLEDDYPELRFERLRTGGQVSGEALRVARQPAARRVAERRPSYDYALVQAQMAAVAIGGWRGYDGYDGYGLNDYSAASPNHSIADRPVFEVEPADRLAEKQQRGVALKALTDAGVPFEAAAAEVGYAPAEVQAMTAQREAEANQAVDRQRQLMADMPEEGSGQ